MKKNYFSKFYFFSKIFFLFFFKNCCIYKSVGQPPIDPPQALECWDSPSLQFKILKSVETKNQMTLLVLGAKHGNFDVVVNQAGNHAAIFDDGYKCFISKKAWELMQTSTDPNDFQYAEVQCADGSWCPTIMPRNRDNVLLHFKF